MRIRKRPLSSLSPVVPPPPDLRLSTVVQLHLPPPEEEDDTAEYFNAPPPSSSSSSHHHLTPPIQLLKKDEDQESCCNNYNDDENNPRSNLLGAKMDSTTLHDDQAFPLKKRIRGNNFELELEDHQTDEKKMKMKTKIQKRGSRGSALMEGSRCSRVNGRGWRCCQQTLVGYSLCEHHLGKGRLRSMMSVRSRAMNIVAEEDDQKDKEKKEHNIDYSTKVIMDDNGDDNENDKVLVMSKRKTKKKLRIVKARSMSSLLGQQGNNVISLAENNNS